MPPANQGRLRLPRGARLPEEVTFVLDVELGKRAAGCTICKTPIPEGSSRVSLLVRLAEPVVSKNGQRRVNERFYTHPGCLTRLVTDGLGGEVVRDGVSCFDCGFGPDLPSVKVAGETVEPSAETLQRYRWTDRCFTTSKFATAPLCPSCAAKPRWTRCAICEVHYPVHMVGVVSDGDDDLLIEACVHCCDRQGLTTRADREAAELEFRSLRDEILERGVFEAGDET